MALALHKLSTSSLRALVASLKGGPLSAGISTYAVRQVAGTHTGEVLACLEQLIGAGSTSAQIAVLAEAIADARDGGADPAALFELVLSGPDVPGVPTGDTAAVMHTLIEGAQREILLVGYAVHNGKLLFERLAERMRTVSSLKVRFCLDITRRPTDTSLASEIVRRFAQEFRTRHWPWPELPELYYDPRSLEVGASHRSSLHAKCVVVDHQTALVTSANFTEAAQQRNIEAGVLIKHAPFSERLALYFDGLAGAGILAPCVWG